MHVALENSKLPQREVDVCKRLIEVRKMLGYDQKQLGTALNVSRDRLASYENFRAPLRYDLGDRVCSTLDLNQRWLATGHLPQLQYINVPEEIQHAIVPRTLFTDAYDGQLSAWMERCLAPGIVWHRDEQGRGTRLVKTEELDLHLVSNNEWKIRRAGTKPKIDPADLLEPLLISRIKKAFAELPLEKRSKFFRHIGRVTVAFLSEHRK